MRLLLKRFLIIMLKSRCQSAQHIQLLYKFGSKNRYPSGYREECPEPGPMCVTCWRIRIPLRNNRNSPVAYHRVPQIVFYSVPFFSGKNTGITITIAITENSMPLITPTAKLYQNMFCLPSKRNGIKPRTVLSIVSMVGMILRL